MAGRQTGPEEADLGRTETRPESHLQTSEDPTVELTAAVRECSSLTVESTAAVRECSSLLRVLIGFMASAAEEWDPPSDRGTATDEARVALDPERRFAEMRAAFSSAADQDDQDDQDQDQDDQDQDQDDQDQDQDDQDDSVEGSDDDGQRQDAGPSDHDDERQDDQQDDQQSDDGLDRAG
jgi:hypothetical protein